MNQKTQKKQRHSQLQEYGDWLLSELEKQGVALSVAGKNALHVKGEITPAQKEIVRVWKRQLIETLSRKCLNCASAMELIENNALWFCPLGCESRMAE